jgi:hypothetical protein
MKSLLVFVIGFTVHFSALSQSKQDLIANWKVINVELLPDGEQEEKQMLATVKSIFLKSTFHFKENNLFTLKSPDKELSTNDAIWKFDDNKKIVVVTERVSKGNPGVLMEIVVKAKDGKYVFLMTETPLILFVEKMQ